MHQGNFVSGIFSVYDSSQALDFSEHEQYPIGVELIFTNDDAGKRCADKLSKVFATLSESSGTIYRTHGKETDPVRGFDCFVKDTDALRRVFAETFDGVGIYHREDERVIPRMELLDEAKRIVASRKQGVAI